MNIQKEREAFESATNIYHCIYNADLNYYFSCSKFVGEKAEIEVNAGWKAWQAAKAQAVPEGFVLVPVQCPDPDFADMLFDELRKNAIGTFGDDMLIHFSNIDEKKIWALMIEAARGGNE